MKVCAEGGAQLDMLSFDLQQIAEIAEPGQKFDSLASQLFRSDDALLWKGFIWG